MTNYYKKSSVNKPTRLLKDSASEEAPAQNTMTSNRPQKQSAVSAVPGTEKLQKVIARSGHCSRREAERIIAQGRIKVDKNIAQLGERVSSDHRIFLDDQELFIAWEKPRPRVLVYNKPPGEICSRNDPDHPNTIFDNLPNLKIGRWISVGRLDINTSGLLLLTNDGELANLLMHPSSEVEREYAVRVLGEVTDENFAQLTIGVQLDDGIARFDKVWYIGGQGANHWYHVVLKEGRNREVRRLWEALGITVSRLSRVRYGVIELPRGQKPGRWEELEDYSMKKLYNSVGLKPGKTQVDDRRKSPSSTGQKTRGKKRLLMPDNRRKGKKSRVKR